MDFLHVINLKPFCLYIDPFSNFDEPFFNDFTKLEPQAFLDFNIGEQIFVVHIWNLVDGSWMKVHEEDFNKAIAIVKNYCIKVTQTLILELQWQFPDQKIMMAFGMVYPQYWLNFIIVEGSFLLCLNVIKSTFCVVRKTVDGIMVPPPLLDSHMLNVQSSCFRLTMGLWSPPPALFWIHICSMCNPLVSSSLCSTMLKGQWLNIQS